MVKYSIMNRVEKLTTALTLLMASIKWLEGNSTDVFSNGEILVYVSREKFTQLVEYPCSVHLLWNLKWLVLSLSKLAIVH